MTLYVVGTPIGNLGDITERAKDILGSVDLILCEDTRVTGGLLSKLGIKTKMAALHQHTKDSVHAKYVKLLREGHDLALVTDAGTPGISDPGGKFVELAVAELGEELHVSPIPGASAVATILSVSGMPADTFRFLSFPPHKKGRQTFFQELKNMPETVVFYESTHRIKKAMEQLVESVPERKMVLGRELTKMHETIYRGTPSEVTEALKAGSLKGEFVIVLAPQK